MRQRDSVIVALPFKYAQAELDALMDSAQAAIWVLFVCLAINAVCFFGGFNTFSPALGLFRTLANVHPICTPDTVL